jgi:hypothetical protein
MKFKAMRIIVPIVYDSIAPHIIHIFDPRSVWIKLRDLYKSKSMNRRLTIMSQLYSLQMTEIMTVEDLLRTVNDLTRQLANIGVIVPDDELVDRELTSLPVSWNVFRQLALQRERSFTFAKLESMLLHEDNIHSRNREREENDEVLSLEQEAFFSCYNSCDNRQAPARGYMNRTGYQGRTNNNARGGSYSDGRENFGFRNPIGGRYNNNRGNPHLRPSDQSNNGSCNECGSPYHWADRCEIHSLRTKL